MRFLTDFSLCRLSRSCRLRVSSFGSQRIFCAAGVNKSPSSQISPHLHSNKTGFLSGNHPKYIIYLSFQSSCGTNLSARTDAIAADALGVQESCQEQSRWSGFLLRFHSLNFSALLKATILTRCYQRKTNSISD